jgi:hypothetical protein
MSIFDPIIPDPNWGLPTVDVDPEEWEDDD